MFEIFKIFASWLKGVFGYDCPQLPGIVMTEIIRGLQDITPEMVSSHPLSPVEAGDTVVGLAPEWLRPLFVLLSIKTKEHNTAAKGLQQGEPDRELVMMGQVCCVLKDLFWCELQMAFFEAIRGAENIGIREGWRVIAVQEEACPVGDGCPMFSTCGGSRKNCRAAGGFVIIERGGGDETGESRNTMKPANDPGRS